MLSHLRVNKQSKEMKGLTRQFTFNNSDHEELAQQIQELEADLKKEQAKTKSIQEMLRLNQELLVKKEQVNKKTLSDLEEKLRGRIWNNDAAFTQKTMKNMEKIQEFHTEIQNRLGIVQHKTLQILIDQEKELIKEYKDKFIQVESQLGTMKINSVGKAKKPESKEFNLWQMIEKYTQENKSVELFNDKLAEENKKIKLDRAEQIKEIAGMKLMIDRLKLEKIKLRRILDTYRFSGSFSRMESKEERQVLTERKPELNNIEKIKIEIEKSKKDTKDEKTKLFLLQESTIELKFILKQAIQDINDRIHSVKKSSADKDEGLLNKYKERNALIGKIYDQAFPPRASLTRRMLIFPHNKFDDIESTMEAIQHLYETYEKSLKSKAL